jgi:hypothetical protein
MLMPGDPAPMFVVASSVNPKFTFDTTAGRYIALSFFGSSKHPFAERMLAEIHRRRDFFDVVNRIFFGVSIDRSDRARLRHEHNGIIWLSLDPQFFAVEA